MTSKAELAERINKAIAPWRKAAVKPPFMPEELVIMAISLCGGKATGERIFLWIGSTFEYYEKLMVRESHYLKLHWSARKQQGHIAVSAGRLFRASICDALDQFDLPIQCSPGAVNVAPVYRTSTRSALNILAPKMGPNDSFQAKAFNFFALPAELRDIIYNMVFKFPRSGLVLERFYRRIEDPPQDRKFLVRSRSYDLDFSHAMLLPHEGTFGPVQQATIKTRPVLDILQPLLVCRQFYNEAMPKFYQLNHFHFPNVLTLRQSLIKMPSVRRDRLTNISFNYDVDSYRIAHHRKLTESRAAVDAFEMLSSIKHLSKVSISVNERAWHTGYDARRFYNKHASVMNMDGIEQLRSLRGLTDVAFIGCPTLERELTAWMTRPRLEGEQAAIPARMQLRKRKREEPEETVLRSKKINKA